MRAEKVVTEIRREQIAQAALDLVAIHGVKRLTIEQIASKVGIVPSALYKHFKNKSQIFDVIIQLLIQQLEEIVKEAQKSGGNHLQRIHQVYINEVRRAMMSPGIPFIVFSDEMLGNDNERKARFCEAHEKRLDAIIKLFQEAQDAGRIRNDLSAETLTTFHFGMIAQVGFLMLNKKKSTVDILRHADLTWNTFAELLKVR